MSTERNVKVFGCGGAGINILKSLDEMNFDRIYVDGSASNMKGLSEDKDNIYLVPGMDGAGKDRSISHEAFKGEATKVLTEHKPGDKLNIVISSLSGGSGSTMAQALVREMIQQDKAVIVVGVITEGSVKELKNSIGSLLTYNNIATRTNKPIAMCLGHNPDRQMVNEYINTFITTVGLITDPAMTEEFDSKDLYNFINYNKVTSLPVGLSIIKSVPNDELVEGHIDDKTTYLASSLLLSTTGTSHSPHYVPEYMANVKITLPDYNLEDIRIDNIVGAIPKILEGLQIKLTAFEDRVVTAEINAIAKAKATAEDDDDMVF